MRTSHRRLLFKKSSPIWVICLTLALFCLGSAIETQAQGIPGLPGSALDAAYGKGVSENKLGSVLFYNYYTSDALSAQVNTRISITNANPSRDIAVHVFFVDSSTCNIADAFICLTRNQTTTFVASDLDPNVTGYLVAIAIDAQGRPTSFNFLAGEALITTPTVHRFSLAAVAAARRDGDFSSPINSDGLSSTLFFNGEQYDFLPYAMMIDSFPSQVSGVGSPLADTRLYLYTPQSNLITGDTSLSATLFVLVSDDQENSFSAQLQYNCAISSDKQRITSIRTSPNINTIVPQGRTGWMRFYSNGNRTIVGDTQGCTVNLNNLPLMGATATKISTFTGGHNLRYLTTFNAPGYSITVPVITPSCGPSTDTQTKGSRLCLTASQ